MSPVYTSSELETPIESLTDEAVLAAAELRMPAERGHRLSELTARRREEPLSAEEQQELMALAQLYQRLWLRQSEALAEAARRGLRAGMHP